MVSYNILVVVLIGGIAVELGVLIFTTWRLGDGLLGVLKMTPAMTLLERVLNAPLRPATPGMVAQPEPGNLGVFFPPGMDPARPNPSSPAPEISEEEIAAHLMRLQRGE